MIESWTMIHLLGRTQPPAMRQCRNGSRRTHSVHGRGRRCDAAQSRTWLVSALRPACPHPSRQRSDNPNLHKGQGVAQ